MDTVKADEAKTYYPPAESRGGWRVACSPDEARALAGMDLERLSQARVWNSRFGVASAVVVIRHGYLVAEWYEGGAGPQTRYNIHSCSKSFTGTAYGMLFDEARRSAPPAVELDRPAYAYIPEGHPLSDPRKDGILLRHLLSMSSGIPGRASAPSA